MLAKSVTLILMCSVEEITEICGYEVEEEWYSAIDEAEAIVKEIQAARL